MASANPRMKFVWLSQASLISSAFWFLAMAVYIIIGPGELVAGMANRLLLFELFIGSLVVVMGAVFAWAELFLRSFSFELGDKELAVQNGIISRRRVGIPYDKIKEIRILRSGLNFVDQMFGLSTLRIETGDRKLFAVLFGIDNPDEVIRKILARSQGKLLPSEAKAGQPDESPEMKLLKGLEAEVKEIKAILDKKEKEKEKPAKHQEFPSVLSGVEKEYYGQDDFSRIIRDEDRKRAKKK